MTLRFGTFNLFQFVAPPFSWYIKKDRFTHEEFQEKKEWVSQQIKRMKCDIIGFQEVFSIDELQALCKEAGFEYFLTVDTPSIEKKSIFTSTVVALASKYPIKDIQKVSTHKPTLKEHHYKAKTVFARKPIKALIELPNQHNIWVYVCHLKSNRLNEFEYTFKEKDTLVFKKEQTQTTLKGRYSNALRQRLCEVTSLYYDIKKQTLPTVLMGDMNDKQYSICLDALTNSAYYNEKTKKSLLIDAYTLYRPKVHNPHPEAKEVKRTPTSYYQGYGNIIDYIFISQNWLPAFKITNYEIFDEHLQKHKDGSLLQSDHAQVVCEISLNA